MGFFLMKKIYYSWTCIHCGMNTHTLLPHIECYLCETYNNIIATSYIDKSCKNINDIIGDINKMKRIIIGQKRYIIQILGNSRINTTFNIINEYNDLFDEISRTQKYIYYLLKAIYKRGLYE